MDISFRDAAQFGLIPLAIWREARGEARQTKIGVAWAIKNRVLRPGWWGHDYISVILRRLQFSSFNWNDPNSQKFPDPQDPSWDESIDVAGRVFTGQEPDPTMGATHYHDKSLDADPPEWARTMEHTVTLGAMRFFK